MAASAEEDDVGDHASVFRSNLSIDEKLSRARTELLDLSARNRLLNMPLFTKSGRIIDVVEQRTADIFRLLVRENRRFGFSAARPAEAGTAAAADCAPDAMAALAEPGDDELGRPEIGARPGDTRLQTRLTSKQLQKRLLDLHHDARTLEEEQGVNILFVALGALRWIDPQNPATERYAPLILVPAALERASAGAMFTLRARPEDFASNLSLEAFLDRTLGIRLPAFEPGDGFDPAAYLGEVAEAVAAQPGWRVVANQIVLGFFSFAKFLMYRDLDPETWPASGKLGAHPLIRGLMAEGFAPDEASLPEDSAIDRFISPAQMLHILDCDSSQALAVFEARRGRNMVIQGPPGTGKSQTIANIVASAVADGKRILFVAEKMAALDVVKRRLDLAGIGDVCLELHSSKANKRALLEELRRSWELGAPKGPDPGTLHARLEEARDRLNDHVARLHRPHPLAGLTPYQVIGHLARLHQDGRAPGEIALDAPQSWSADDFAERQDAIAELAERIGAIGRPDDHAWRGVGLRAILPNDAVRLRARIEALVARIELCRTDHAALARCLALDPPEDLRALDPLIAVARRIAGAPRFDTIAIGNPAWDERRGEIATLIEAGALHAGCRAGLGDGVAEEAWAADLAATMTALETLPPGLSGERLAGLAEAHALLPRLIAAGAALARMLGEDNPATLAQAQRQARIGAAIAAAPDADPAAFAAPLWDDQRDRAAAIAAAVAALAASRAIVVESLTEAARSLDLSATRATLAAHGRGPFRWLSAEWRAARRRARSVLIQPDAPLADRLAILDALGRHRAALATIREADGFARAAFGCDWQGEHSAAAPLERLVDWMGAQAALGPAPRRIAARQPDRAAIGIAAARVAMATTAGEILFAALWRDLATARAAMFGAAADPGAADLAAASAAATRWHRADRVSAAWLRDPGSDLDLRRARLRLLADGQRTAAVIAAAGSLGETVFGSAWHGVQSDWPALCRGAEWIESNRDIRLLASGMADRAAPRERAEAAGAAGAALTRDLATLFDDLALDRHDALGATDPAHIPLARLRTHLARWAANAADLPSWVAYRACAARAAMLGCAALVQGLADGRFTPADAVPTLELAYYEAIFADQVAAEPALATFDGMRHGRLVRAFAATDRARIAAAGLETVRAHHARVPARDGGAVGPLGVLRTEIARRRGHMPIRKLMEQAGPAVQALKPVFMMSPLSIAQFLTPGIVEFDLLVMDEASQIQPVDALGAVARAQQVVVVGDPRQLPPTGFFAKLTSGSDEEADGEDGAGRVGDIESILGLFSARGLPMRMLRWHYRSKHPSLIAVSNRQFYDNKLFIVPSPLAADHDLGLRLHPVPSGLFEAGTTRTNPIEAAVVAQAIVAHARDHPGLSLGVAAFSAAQRRAIVDQLELLRSALPAAVEAFFQAHPAEPFFVKNLENVQGDERDVIFISVGYGPTMTGGRVPMRFGPLGAEGGERRLNVLISRAKQRCDVFASMTDDDIDPEFARGRKGILALRLFLQFARTGRMALAESSGRDHDSPFEAQVAQALEARGYRVDRQVGLAGFFIDLAIADRERPGRYLLGIECDGASYHDAKSARDRDRLRQSILESHGWTIHRVWSLDWFQRPAEQCDLIVARIAAARAEQDAAPAAGAASPPVPPRSAAIAREERAMNGAIDAAAPARRRYSEAAILRPAGFSGALQDAPHDLLAGLAEQVVEIEGPVHIDEIVARIRAAWALKRAGARIQSALARAVDLAVRSGRLTRDGDFLAIPGRDVAVRDRSAVRAIGVRRCEALPPAELECAILDIVRTHFGATDDQVALAVARAIGFKATSGPVRALIGDIVATLLATGSLDRRNGVLVLGRQEPVAPAPASAASPPPAAPPDRGPPQPLAPGESPREI